MEPYIYLYSYLAVILAINLYAIANGPKFQSIDQKLYWFLAIPIIAFIALRDSSVGADTYNYVRFFNDPNFYYTGDKTDVGFEQIGRLLRIFGKSDEYFIFFISLFYSAGLSFIIYKVSENKALSWLLFAVSGTSSINLFLWLSMVRQCCALTFFFFAVYILFESKLTERKKIIYFGVMMAFALSTHGSSLLAVPAVLYFYYRPAFNRKLWVILIAISYILAALNISYVTDILELVFSFLNSGHYEGYADVAFGIIDAKGWLNMDLIPYSVIAVFCLWFSDDETYNKWYMQLFLTSVLMNNLFFDNLMWARLILYYSLFMLIALPNMIIRKSKLLCFGVYSVVFVYYIYKTYTQLLSNMFAITGNIIVPYHSWALDFLFY